MSLKEPMIIIMRFGENNVLCPKYINIYEFRGVWKRMNTDHLTFFDFSKKKKKYKIDIGTYTKGPYIYLAGTYTKIRDLHYTKIKGTYTKIKFYVILI